MEKELPIWKLEDVWVDVAVLALQKRASSWLMTWKRGQGKTHVSHNMFDDAGSRLIMQTLRINRKRMLTCKSYPRPPILIRGRHVTKAIDKHIHETLRHVKPVAMVSWAEEVVKGNFMLEDDVM